MNIESSGLALDASSKSSSLDLLNPLSESDFFCLSYEGFYLTSRTELLQNTPDFDELRSLSFASPKASVG